jgi:hypothetical protein
MHVQLVEENENLKQINQTQETKICRLQLQVGRLKARGEELRASIRQGEEKHAKDLLSCAEKAATKCFKNGQCNYNRDNDVDILLYCNK